MSDAPLDAAKESIKTLLELLQIERVVCVDDVYAKTVDDADAVAAFQTLPVGAIEACDSVLTAKLGQEADLDVRTDLFREYWRTLDIDQKRRLVLSLNKAAGASEAAGGADAEFADLLEALVGVERLRKLAPSQWESQAASLITVEGDKRVLVLFDQDLSQDNGSATGGVVLIKAVLSSGDKAHVVCGLLTHTIDVSNQHSEWERLAAENDLDRDRFLAIPKAVLRTDPLGFGRMLKLLALSPVCSELRAKAAEVFQNALATAMDRIGKITVYDFDYVVCQAAREEGLWEPDMLFRLLSSFHRLEARKLARTTGALEELAGRLRRVSGVPTVSPSDPTPTSWRIQRDEMYEPGDHINALYLPIDLGDVFRKRGTTSKKVYILLAQPCELMVRSDGKRHGAVHEAILVEAKPLEGKSQPDDHEVELKYFSDVPGEHYVVNLKMTNALRLFALDLCAFNARGEAVLRVGDPPPSALIPAWKERYARVQKDVEDALRDYRKYAPQPGIAEVDKLKTAVQSKLVPSISNADIFKLTVRQDNATTVVDAGFDRISRLARPRALALLRRYAEFISRTAFERDLGQIRPKAAV